MWLEAIKYLVRKVCKQRQRIVELEAKVDQLQSKIDRLTTQNIDDEPQFIYPEQTP